MISCMYRGSCCIKPISTRMMLLSLRRYSPRSLQGVCFFSFREKLEKIKCYEREKTAKSLQRFGLPNVSTGLASCKTWRAFSSSRERTCWSCGSLQRISQESFNELFFCSSCFKVLPVDPCTNYFQMLNCPEEFNIDTDILSRVYRKLQSLLHPDKFGQLSEMEQKYSADQSSQVNKAYGTLMDPLNRAEYMLELKGKPILEDNTSTDPNFLMEMFEINEALAECSSRDDLQSISQDNEECISQLIEETTKAFDAGQYKVARDVVVKLKYHFSIRDTIKSKETQM